MNSEELAGRGYARSDPPFIPDDSTGLLGLNKGFYRCFHKFTGTSQTTDFLNLYILIEE